MGPHLQIVYQLARWVVGRRRLLRSVRADSRRAIVASFTRNSSRRFTPSALSVIARATSTAAANSVLGRSIFQGELYQRDGITRLGGITIDQAGGATLDLDEAETGRLFMIPDGSIVWALMLREHGEAPAGLDVMSNNPFMAEDENTSVIAYRDDEGTSLCVDALYIRRLVLADDAPERLATVACRLMAISAPHQAMPISPSDVHMLLRSNPGMPPSPHGRVTTAGAQAAAGKNT